MNQWLGRSLKRKLSFILILAMIVPIISLGFFSYDTASSLSEEKAKLTGMNILRQLDTQLQLMVKDVESMSIFLIGDEDVQQYLRASRGNVVLRTSIIVFLTNLVFSKDYIANISIIPDDNKEVISYSSKPFEGLSFTLPENGPFSEGELPEKVWSIPSNEKGSNPAGNTITLTRPIRSTYTYMPLGYLTISLNQSVISRYLRQSGMEGDGYVLLLDGDNRIIAGQEQVPGARSLAALFPGIHLPEAPSGFLNYGKGSDRKTLMYYKMPNTDWVLLGVIPFAQYSSENQYLLRLTALVIAAAAFIIAAILLFLISSITKPLHRLTVFLKQGNLEAKLPVPSTDEIGQLIISYNRLSRRIRRLTAQVKENEARKKEADLLALQAQINPHFLYNTLASVHWMALMNRDNGIASMVDSLSSFLRFSLNQGEEFCEVQQEIAHVESYIQIQSIRYPDQFTVDFRVDPDCLHKKTLKLLLQPLIENAILHGVLQTGEQGRISIRVRSSGSGMVFTVQDNGVGMSPHVLRQLHSSLTLTRRPRSGSGSYGLRNVHSRLTMHYSGNEGLQVQSAEGRGTKISFTIPYIGGDES
ncbi:histidine kinase [Paenibacillus sp. P96]|uniref:histidine kinase n=1 Tax=Paenibacillus zeirhizosphaerae TaxID=2987519 RepID=A0ABT9FMF2_9BACL|nr:histidine kinase [Paenibacillus sp. P96]MDP4095893.1 histidine kinase [Paenibacillus sp. P96]